MSRTAFSSDKEAVLIKEVRRFITSVVSRFLDAAENVYFLGPLPRPAGELLGTPWQITATFHHERTLIRLDLGDRFKCLPIGRSLVRKMGRNERGI